MRHGPVIAAMTPEQSAGPAPVLTLDLPGITLDGRAVLGPVTLRVWPGETVVLTGPSGIGKSTLLRAAMGLLPVAGGRVARPARMGVVFQEPTLLPWRSCLRNITLTTGADDMTARAALADVGLAGREAAFPGALSLGQQRRLALARAFASRPEILFLDEPFVSLDPALAEEMMALFADLRDRSGAATLLVTHSTAEAARLGTRILRLDAPPGGGGARILSDLPAR